MSFWDRARLDTSQVTGGGRGRRGGAVVGGGAGGVVLLILGLLFGGNVLGGSGSGGLAFDPNDILAQGTGDSGLSGMDFSQCQTGADANANDTCQVIGTVNSVQDYWTDALPADADRQYTEAKTVIYSGSTDSACGTASAATGPFYCPTDRLVYIDAAFFDDLTATFGADGGTFAQMYVVPGAGQRVNPETWTHGSSEQRKRWFLTGYQGGTLRSCNTLDADRL